MSNWCIFIFISVICQIHHGTLSFRAIWVIDYKFSMTTPTLIPTYVLIVINYKFPTSRIDIGPLSLQIISYVRIRVLFFRTEMRTVVNRVLIQWLVYLLLLFVIEVTCSNLRLVYFFVFKFFFVFYLLSISPIYGIDHFILYTWGISCIRLSVLFYSLEHLLDL